MQCIQVSTIFLLFALHTPKHKAELTPPFSESNELFKAYGHFEMSVSAPVHLKDTPTRSRLSVNP